MDETPGMQPCEGEVRVGRRLILTIIAMVIVSDFTLYQARGFFGPAVFFPLAAILLMVGTHKAKLSFSSALTPKSTIGAPGTGSFSLPLVRLGV